MNRVKATQGIEIGVDTGGTFTDIVFRFPNGKVRIAKVPSTPADPSQAVIDGIMQSAQDWGVDLGEIERVVHGTTVATNAIIERAGARVGLITTDGFRDVLEIGRQMRQDMYELQIKPVTPVFLVPRARRKEVPERLMANGDVRTPLDIEAVRKVAEELIADGVESIAICFLFSFLNPSHEQQARDIIEAAFPDVHVSLSSEIDPAVREYERTVSTVFDAYVKPVVFKYLERLERRLIEIGIEKPFQVIQSRGGLTSAYAARQKPVRLVLSGPAGGVIAGKTLSEISGEGNIITVDVGGTSCDIALINEGKAVIRSEGTIGGYPVRISMVDVNAIGAGGGSIAWVDTAGSLRVGPHSAGSEPGPACYRRGGENPTVTDASMVLGYFDPAQLGGGRLSLDRELSFAAIKTKIADPMNTTVEEAALGIHRVVNSQMAEGIRLVSIKQGFDPRLFTLVPMGGGGALHGCQLAQALGIRKIIIPDRPGVMAAEGLLSAAIEHEAKHSVHWSLASASLKDIQDCLSTMDTECSVAMVRDGAPEHSSLIQHLADVCYEGQSFNLEVPFVATEEGLRALRSDFYELHDRVFGQSTDGPVRLVQLKSVHSYQPQRVESVAIATESVEASSTKTRDIILPDVGVVEATIIQRESLRCGAVITGPAIVEQEDTTILVDKGWTGDVLENGLLVLSFSSEQD